jgi:hypothetical protein
MKVLISVIHKQIRFFSVNGTQLLISRWIACFSLMTDGTFLSLPDSSI